MTRLLKQCPPCPLSNLLFSSVRELFLQIRFKVYYLYLMSNVGSTLEIHKQ